MKTTAMAHRQNKVFSFRQRKGYTYPNAAERSYFLNKALDCALAAATSIGTVVILFVLIVLG